MIKRLHTTLYRVADELHGVPGKVVIINDTDASIMVEIRGRTGNVEPWSVETFDAK